VLCLGALASLLWQTSSRSPAQLWVPFAMAVLAFMIEAGYRLATGRTIRLSNPQRELK
jgi:hypothetical protein